MFEIVSLLLAMAMTVLVGIPVATRLARVHVWRRSAMETMATERMQHERMFPFEPLDLGPDLMKWPSEIERETTAMPEAQWPSQSWDDPHYGKPTHERDLSTLGVSTASTTAHEKLVHEPAPKQPMATKQEKPKASQRPTTAKVASPVPTREPPIAPPSGGGLPNRATVEAMIAELGLAGTVQALMRSEGWDFKEAASWLARIRRGQ